MSYKLYAKSKGRTLQLTIEEKHKYNNLAMTNITLPMVANGDGYRCTGSTIHKLFDISNIRFTRGTGASEVIGDKINLKNIQFNYDFSLKGNDLIDHFPHGDLVDLRFDFRLLVVSFENPMIDNAIAEWFNRNYVPIELQADGSASRISNQTSYLRESTNDTGKFKIIDDRKFSLGKKCNRYTYNFNWKLNKTCTLESNAGQILNEDLTNTYVILFTPMLYRYDVDAVTSDQWYSIDNNYNIAVKSGFAKLTYYDI